MNAAPLAFGVAALALLMGSRARASTGQGARACSDSAQATSSRERAALVAWVDCAGRTSDEVIELARLLERARRQADADAVRARWNARRSVEDAPATGQLTGRPAAEASAALDAPTPPATVPEPPPRRRSHVDADAAPRGRGRSTGRVDLVEARRLAPMVARSIRSGGGYRSALRRFQAAAGLVVDGAYGPSSRAALRYFGVPDAPPARVATDRPEVYTPPSGSERRAPSEVSTEDALYTPGPLMSIEPAPELSSSGPVSSFPWTEGA